MKLIRSSILLLAVLLLSCKSSCVTFKISTDEAMHLNGKWVYFFSMYGNQLDIIDSCIIENNRAHLSGNIPQAEVMAEIMIPNEGVYFFIAVQGDKIKFRIDSTIRSYFPESQGSFATSEMNSISKRYRYIDSLMQVMNTFQLESVHRQGIADSIDLYKRNFNNLVNRALNNRKSILLAYTAKSWYIDSNPEVSADSMDCIVKKISEHFPNNIHLSTMYRDRPSLPPTKSSMRAFNRKAQLTGVPKPYPNEEVKPQKSDNASFDAVSKYQVGDIVENLALPTIAGKAAGLDHVVSDYILIDFWASWCSPCRREIPQLVDIQKKFRQLLAIYAVSLDDDTNEWQKVVNNDGMKDMINVRLDQKNHLFNLLVGKFDIRTIPHNFLLDKNRKIIAVDLTGDELEKKMNELIGK